MSGGVVSSGPRGGVRGRRGAAVSGGVDVALVVIAKAPWPGRSKTRLCPPCTPVQAAALAAAALEDTLDVVAAAPARRRLLALDGEMSSGGSRPRTPASPGRPVSSGGSRPRTPAPSGREEAWGPRGFDVVGQRGGGLGERLGAALAAAGGPALVVGMDTPQLTLDLLAAGVAALDAADAVLGPALDGGYWTIGLREPDPAVFAGVPMSSGRTYAEQRRRLRELDLTVAELPALRDVDTIADARVVARATPTTRFAHVLASVDLTAAA